MKITISESDQQQKIKAILEIFDNSETEREDTVKITVYPERKHIVMLRSTFIDLINAFDDEMASEE